MERGRIRECGDFFVSIWLCVKIAPKGVRELIDIPATIAGITLPGFAWRYPQYWGSDKGQSLMNALYWMVPCGFAWLYLAVRALVSPYLVYKARDEKAEAREKELSRDLLIERDKNVPQLSSDLELLSIGELSRQGQHRCIGISVRLVIRNAGAPSVAEYFKLCIDGYGFSASQIAPTMFTKTIPGYDDDGKTSLALGKEDMIFEKSVHPIPHGGLVRGWLIFLLHDAERSEIEQVGVKFTVSFFDVNKREYSTSASSC